MKTWRNHWRIPTVVIFLSLLGGIAWASSATPGSADDPLVTKSYVDERLEKDLQKNIEAAVKKILQDEASAPIPRDDNSASSKDATDGATTVEELKPGDIIQGKGGTQFIVRTGTAQIVANQHGEGLSDVTGGRDLREGATVALNHLLIVPRSDGRGLKITGNQNSFIIIYGPYEVVRKK